MSTGGIIGIAVAVPIGVLAILAVAGYYLWKHHKSSKASKSQRLAEVNDYSFNPNSASALNMGGPGGGPGGAGAGNVIGAGAAVGAGTEAANQGQSNYRGWGPAPTSPQMEQVPSSSLAHMNAYEAGGAQNGLGRGVAAAGAGVAGAAILAGSGSSGGERGSDELIIPRGSSRGSPDGAAAAAAAAGHHEANASHGYYSPSGQEIYNGGPVRGEDGEVAVDHHYGDYAQQQEQQYQYPQQHTLGQGGNHDFDFDDSPEYLARHPQHNMPEIHEQQPTHTPRLQIQNVAARRDSPRIEHSGWPLQNEGTSGTHGVSQNF